MQKCNKSIALSDHHVSIDMHVKRDFPLQDTLNELIISIYISKKSNAHTTVPHFHKRKSYSYFLKEPTGFAISSRINLQIRKDSQ